MSPVDGDVVVEAADDVGRPPEDDQADPPPPRSRSIFVAAALGAALLAALLTALVLTLLSGVDEVTVPEPTLDAAALDEFGAGQVEAARSFLEDWNRSRLVTVRVESVSVRETIAGERLETDILLVQRPPDRLVSRLGGIVGIYDGRPVTCDSGASGDLTCSPVSTSETYQERLDDELVVFASYLAGDDPAYLIREIDDACYELVANRRDVLLEYGERSEFCFDPATGALVSTVTDFGSVVETTEAVTVSTQVTDADFTELLPT
jgi:hypothetical protein